MHVNNSYLGSLIYNLHQLFNFFTELLGFIYLYIMYDVNVDVYDKSKVSLNKPVFFANLLQTY